MYGKLNFVCYTYIHICKHVHMQMCQLFVLRIVITIIIIKKKQQLFFFNLKKDNLNYPPLISTRSNPLSPEKWFSSLDSDGRLKVDVDEIREIIFRGVSIYHYFF